MIIFYKNRGILLPVFITIPVIGIVILSVILRENVGGIFASDYDKNIVFGIGLLISGIWTYLKRTDFIEVNGVKEEIEMNHHFFFVSLKLWSKILLGAGILVLLGGIAETLDM